MKKIEKCIIEIHIVNEMEMTSNTNLFVPVSVARTIKVNGKEVYTDKMTHTMCTAVHDAISQLEDFILGTEKSKGCGYVCSNSRKRTGFFKKIWRKLLGK